MDFQVPRIVHEEVDEQRGVFVIEPLDRGFGYTFGNSLRRVLLSSLEGAAVTSVKFEGVAHEFTTLPGVKEDVTDIILQLKNLTCRLHGESPEIEVRLTKKGSGTVTAGDIEAPADLEILNPDLVIANLSDKGRLEMTLTIGRGRGYVPAAGVCLGCPHSSPASSCHARPVATITTTCDTTRPLNWEKHNPI